MAETWHDVMVELRMARRRLPRWMRAWRLANPIDTSTVRPLPRARMEPTDG